MKESRDILDQRIIQLSKIDSLRFRDLIEGGTLVFGGIGAGKTSSNGSVAARAFPAAHLGDLESSVKSDDIARWIECARESGREEGLIMPDVEETE
jgi:hypothetical protein